MKIIAVVGDYYHDEKLFKRALSEAVETLSDIDLEYSDHAHLVNDLKAKPDLVILASENRIEPEENKNHTWMDRSKEQKIIEYVRSGGNWLAWHSGLAGYEKCEDYVAMLGGYFAYHPKEHVNVQYAYRKDHELSKGKENTEIKDEHYFIHSVEESSCFLQSSSTYGTSDAGWTRKYGTGKVCCYVPSHNGEGLMSASVQNDLKSIVEWARS